MGSVLSTNTILGYAALIALGGAVYYLNSNAASSRGRRGVPMKPAGKIIESRKQIKEQPKARKSKKDAGPTAADEARSTGKALNKKAEGASHALFDASPDFTKDSDKQNDAEFARQLSNMKTGTNFTSTPQSGPRQKSVKQARAQEKPVVVETSSENATAPSSAAGGDADDDQSPVSSPDLSATTNDDPVADMLQPAAPAASILKITESNKPALPRKENRQPTFEAVETKKQRQNRKKNEARKAAVEEQEKERKVLMEKQRRTAREAEGRAAKDGSVFMAARAPASPAWNGPPATTNGQDGTHAEPVELLDTYESSTVKATAAPTSVPLQTQGSSSELLPEEERELRMAIEDSKWEEVKKKPRKAKKSGAEPEAAEQPALVAAPIPEQNDFGVPPVIKPTGPGQKWDMTLVSVEDGYVNEYEKEVQDSEWEVA